ncbi:lolA [Wigglesworthia glossinidia endosymbiont of Glossina brevipalpis]|uniref:Outer-membrane lipoprotein carrier protein n=1 Tax=Wigglesworthia glossinidia brevipalpis TaxID=36870 RepID=LOLA_WIGBR|nr:RecName: Full=Outer-membrane lipoprotein carrier protein; Flags: Precursor [Wigglesworthia glossinidia endosymbiont of Glossina brevipalpis]BAC24636.1 lolA [Wigglesworthia glossinidia endosymbiont of Glossina brevipalpis]
MFYLIKKLPKFILFSLYLYAFSSISDSSGILSERLNLINSFYSTVRQKVTSSSGDIVQESKGEIWIKKPNLFKSILFSPYENIASSDGNTLWLYDSETNQVTINWIKNIISDSPLYLIIKNNKNSWENFNIKNINDTFYIYSKKLNSSFRKITIIIDKKGILKNLIILSNTNYKTYYTFNIKKTIISSDFNFNFKIPKGAYIDDQR